MAGQQLEYVTLDVFTDSRYTGNPLAIVDVPTDVTLSQTQKQIIAREFNFSETVFLHDGLNLGKAEWTIDIFTPKFELPFAGHPTIGSASLLATRHPSITSAILRTKAGPIQVTYDRDDKGTFKEAHASIPHNVHVHSKNVDEAMILDIQPQLKNVLDPKPDGYPVVSIVKGMTFVLVNMKSREALTKVVTSSVNLDTPLDPEWKPSFSALYFYYEESDSKVHTRMTEAGIEDPATGSAASSLTSFLALSKGADKDVEITQGEDIGRKSRIGVQVNITDKVISKVVLSGTSAQVMKGSIVV